MYLPVWFGIVAVLFVVGAMILMALKAAAEWVARAIGGAFTRGWRRVYHRDEPE